MSVFYMNGKERSETKRRTKEEAREKGERRSG